MNNLILTLSKIPKVGIKSIYYFLDERHCIPQNDIDIIERFKVLKSNGKKITIPTIEEIKTARENANEILCKSYNQHIRVVNILDKSYPKSLKYINEPPVLLFYKGNINNLNNRESITIVGSRNADKAGLKASYDLSKLLSDKGYNIVSGLAMGCDTYAHKGALVNNRTTTAVMPCGLDRVYPKQNENLAQDILDNNGCLISEYSIKSNIYKNNFIKRDRIESGLSILTIVAQSDINSGTRHTVEYAKKQNKLLACFDIDSSLNQNLIKDNKCIKIDKNYNIKEIEEKIKIRKLDVYSLELKEQLMFNI